MFIFYCVFSFEFTHNPGPQGGRSSAGGVVVMGAAWSASPWPVVRVVVRVAFRVLVLRPCAAARPPMGAGDWGQSLGRGDASEQKKLEKRKYLYFFSKDY